MNCKQIRDMMGPYLYGDLLPAEMREVRLHTQECPECREELAERGWVVASLSDAVPQLTDDERQSIAWTVRGAIRHSELARHSLWFRWSPGLAVGAVLVAGLAAGALISIRATKPPPAAVQVNAAKRSKPAKPVSAKTRAPLGGIVRITEEQSASARKDVEEPGGFVPKAAVAHRRASPVDRFAAMMRRGAVFGSVARKNGKETHKTLLGHEEPVPLADGSDTLQIPHPDQGMKLPEPTDLNDAQTSPEYTGTSQ